MILIVLLIILISITVAGWSFLKYITGGQTHLPDTITFPKNLWLSLGAVVLAYNFFIHATLSDPSFPTLGFALFNATWLFAFWLSRPKPGHKKLALILTSLSLFSASALIFRANGFVQAINIFAVFSSNLLLVLLQTYSHIPWRLSWLGKNITNLIILAFNQIGLIFKHSRSKKTNSNTVA